MGTKRRVRPNVAGVNIQGADKASVEAAGRAVLRILAAKADQTTIVAALEAFTRVTKVEGRVEGCQFSGIGIG